MRENEKATVAETAEVESGHRSVRPPTGRQGRGRQEGQVCGAERVEGRVQEGSSGWAVPVGRRQGVCSDPSSVTADS